MVRELRPMLASNRGQVLVISIHQSVRDYGNRGRLVNFYVFVGLGLLTVLGLGVQVDLLHD